MANEITANVKKVEKPALDINASLSRAALMSGVLGGSYSGDRNVYTALGYPTDINYADYKGKYDRQDISKRIIDAYPDATWRGEPKIFEVEDADKKTEFETKIDEIVARINLFHYFNRVDKLAGIGQYAVLYLGYQGGDEDLAKDVGKATGLLYVQPYSESNASIKTLVTDKTDARYGKPETYELKTSNVIKDAKLTASAPGTITVHWSRIVHVAEGLLESDIYGTPRLKAVYNRLMNMQLLSGGSAEMFWRGAFPGLALEMDAETKLSPQDEDDLEDEIEAYVHKLNRYLRLKGVEAKSLAPQISDPKAHIDVQLLLISGATGIPVRILTGAERGELASTQDKENWNDRVDERRINFAEPMIILQFISLLQRAGVLPMLPQEIRVSVSWPAIDVQSAKERADVALSFARALQAYVRDGGSEIMQPIDFFTKVMGFTDEESLMMVDAIGEMQVDEDEDFEGVEE